MTRGLLLGEQGVVDVPIILEDRVVAHARQHTPGGAL